MATNTEKMLMAKARLRLHGDWSDEQIADSCGIHVLEIPQTVAIARQELIDAGDLAGVQSADKELL